MSNPRTVVGIPASPQVAQQFVIEALKIGPMTRSELVTQVRRIAVARGYVLLEGRSARDTITRVLSVLLKRGSVVSPRLGWWALPQPTSNPNSDLPEDVLNADAPPLRTPENETMEGEQGPPRLVIQRQIGDGPEAVYVYYHDAHAELAQRDSRSEWECKIGWTIGEPDARIIGQGAMTCFPRPPIIGLVIRTRDGRNLERILHSALTMAGKRVSDNGGTEWFMTSPDVVERWFDAYLKTVELLR